MTIITSNEELKTIAQSGIFEADKHFAIRLNKEQIKIFECEKDFKDVALTKPNAVQGLITGRNWVWYRF